MARFTKILILMLAVAVIGSSCGWGAARWEKSLKLTAYYDGSSDAYTVTGGIAGVFTRQGITSRWTNEIRTNYSEITTEGVSVKNPNSNWTVAETYTKNISAFAYWKLYFGASDFNLDGKDILSQTNLTVNKNFSRYLSAGAGLSMTKTLDVATAAAETYLRLEAVYDRSLGYRTRITFAPAFQLNTTNTSTYYIQSNLSFTYIFGKRISFVVTSTPGYDSVTKKFGGITTFNLVYDIFQY